MLRSESSPELTDVLGQVGHALRGVQEGEGTVGKLLKDPQAYQALVGLLRSSTDAAEKGKDTLTAIKQDAEAIKNLPLVRGYVEDPVKILVRPDCEKNRRIFAEGELFEPGRAVLTAEGRSKLDELAPWLASLRHKGSEVVIVSYAEARKGEQASGQHITRQQSEAVAEYLKKTHSAHKLGWVSWRKVTTLGMGSQPPPEPERSAVPAARVEVVVFVPQS